MPKTHVTIIGNVTADPVLRPTKAGEPFATFSVASTPRRFDKDTGVWLDMATSYYDVAAYYELGINVLNSLKKGQPVLVTGTLQIREYPLSAGGVGYSANVRAEIVGHDLRKGSSAFTRRSRPTLVLDDPDDPAEPSLEGMAGPAADTEADAGTGIAASVDADLAPQEASGDDSQEQPTGDPDTDPYVEFDQRAS